jgi:hypothetical protein
VIGAGVLTCLFNNDFRGFSTLNSMMIKTTADDAVFSRTIYIFLEALENSEGPQLF